VALAEKSAPTFNERGALACAARPEKGRGELHTWEEKPGTYLRMTFY